MSAVHILTSFMPHFFYKQLFVTPPTPTTDCTGRTIVVTGANVGLGKEAARHYVRLNAAKVILACRSIERGQAAKADIEKTTGRKDVIEVWTLDLQDFESVKAFATKIGQLERVDTVVENAGIATQKFTKVGNYESTVTVNVVSTFLLAVLLLPKLQETAEKFNVTPTLTIVSSELHHVTALPERRSPSILGTLNNEKTARMTDRYNISKLLEVLAVREMARISDSDSTAKQSRVTINTVNPGWCHSDLLREISNPVLRGIQRMLCRTTEVGSRTLVHAGLAGPDTHGKYMSDCKIEKCAPLVEGKQGRDLQKRAWEEISEELEKIVPGSTKVLAAQV